jgi:hypothetical protein
VLTHTISEHDHFHCVAKFISTRGNSGQAISPHYYKGLKKINFTQPFEVINGFSAPTEQVQAKCTWQVILGALRFDRTLVRKELR